MNYIKFKELLEKYKLPIGLSLLGIVLIIGGMIFSKSPEVSYPKESLIAKEKPVNVDISGAVVNPGVYKLKTGELVENAVHEAGGFSEAANKEFISKSLNLAQKLSDGMKIYIPFEGEAGGANSQGIVSGANTQAQVNINMATQSELEALPGVGPVTAAKIISGRPYQKIEDLLNQKIVSKSTFEKIKDLIVIF